MPHKRWNNIPNTESQNTEPPLPSNLELKVGELNRILEGFQEAVYNILTHNGSKKNEIEKRILSILIEIEEILRKQGEDVQKCMDDYIGWVCRILYDVRPKKLTYSILTKPNWKEWTYKQWTHIGEWESSENKKAEKYSIFQEALREFFWANLDLSIDIYEEQEGKREHPYKIIHLTKWDTQRTYLISNKIWEATFIYDGLIGPEKFISISKNTPMNWKFPRTIKYWNQYKENLKESFSDEYLFEKKEERELKREDIKKYLEKYPQSKEKSLLILSAEDIKSIEIWWKKIIAIAKICQIEFGWDQVTPSWFKKFLKKLFWEEWYQEQEASLKEQIKNALEQYAQSKEKSLLILSAEDIKSIEIWWKKIITIAKIYQIEFEWDVVTTSWFKKFLKKLFWEEWYQEQEASLKEQIKNALEQYAQSKEKSLLMLSWEDIRSIVYMVK